MSISEIKAKYGKLSRVKALSVREKKYSAALIALFILVGYGVADAADILPGFVTFKAQENAPAPYPHINPQSDDDMDRALPLNQAPLPDDQAVQSALENLSDQIPGKVGAIVMDAVTGKQLGALAPDDLFPPASTLKILTAFSALTELGSEFRFTTRASLDETSLYLVGGGDILLAADKGNSQSAVGYAGLGDLARSTAQALDKQGIDAVDVYVDTSLYSGSKYASSLSAEDYRWTMETAPLAIDHSLGEGGEFLSDPAGHALSEFVDHLSTAGIKALVQGEKPAPNHAKEIAKISSAPLRLIVDEMLRVSDNAEADNLAHYLGAHKNGQGNFEGGSQAVKAILEEQLSRAKRDSDADGHELNIHTLMIEDGSGLSPANKITPRILGDVLSAVWNCQENCSTVQMGVGMPYAGYDGTLSGRFVGSIAAGRVHAKTGSITSTSALAGYAYTSQGRPLIFAIIADSASGEGAYGFRPAIDDAVNAIVAL